MRKPENLKNYTTTVTTEKTVTELQTLLVGKGAKKIFIEYQNGEPQALAFEITLKGYDLNYRLPCNVEGAYQAMCDSREVQQRYKNKDQAKRTAWRNLLAWVEAQIAMIEMRQVEMSEVFLPYMTLPQSNQTLFQFLDQNPHQFFEMYEQKQLTSGQQDETKLIA